MSALAFFFIVVSLLSFVVAQLILKRAMEFSIANGMRNARFISLAAIGLAATALVWVAMPETRPR